MKYFIDGEFHEDGKTIDLISIALVAEDGREYYACSLDAELHRCHQKSSWLKENVSLYGGSFRARFKPTPELEGVIYEKLRARVLDRLGVESPVEVEPKKE